MLDIIFLLHYISALQLTPIPDTFAPPPITIQSSSVYDKTGNQIITIGGWDPTVSKMISSIISFNLTSQKFSTILPTSIIDYGRRSGHKNFIRKDRKIISIGTMSGCASFNLLNYEWKLEEVSGDPFPYLIGFGSEQYEKDGKQFIAIFGGFTSREITNDLYLINIDDMKNTKVNQKGKVPIKRAGASLVFYKDCLYLFGFDEISMESTSELYKFDLNTEIWEIVEVQGEIPASRINHDAFVYKDDMFILFGFSYEGKIFSDVFRFGFLDKTWKKIGDFRDVKRYDSQGVIIEDKIYLLFGRNEDQFRSDIIMFQINERNLSVSVVSSNFVSPSARSSHCSAVINDNMYMYGGEMTNTNADVSIFTDMWRFNLESKYWEPINYSGDSPSPRTGFSCMLIENHIIIMFGGNNQDTFYNDVYFYYEPIQKWFINEFNGEPPAPRINSCLAYHNHNLYIIGGKNKFKGFNDIWQLSYETGKYTQIKYMKKSSVLENDIHNCHAFINFENNSIFLIILGGQSFKSIPNSYLYNLTINESKITEISKFSLSAHIKIKSSLIHFDNKLLIIGGFIYDYFVTDPLILVDLSKNSSKVYKFEPNSEKEIEKALSLNSHSAVHYKDSIYIFGGVTSADYLRSYLGTTNDFYKISFENSEWLKIPCSKGTFGLNCEPCPEGTYQFKEKCEHCPKGTFSNKTALKSDMQCIPCGYGEYHDGLGAAACKICPSYAFCPIGSKNINSNYFLTPNQSIQPAQFKSEEKKYQEILDILINILVSSGVIIFLLVLAFGRFRLVVEKWDVFISGHQQELGVPVILRRNIIGGVFSVAFYISAFLVILANTLAYGYSNTYEIRALVPLISLDEEVVSQQLIFNFTFYMYGDECEEIHPSNFSSFIEEKNLVYRYRDISTKKEKNNCEVILKYSKATLTSNQAFVLIRMKERRSFASAITLSTVTDSSIPGELSNEIITIDTGSKDLAFRGVIPTVFYLKFIPSVFTHESSDKVKKSTGFHVFTSQEPTRGGLCSQTDLFSKIYLFMKVEIFKSDTAMETTRLEKQTILNYFGGLLGAVFGIMGSFAAFLSLIENYTQKFEKCLKDKENRKKCLEKSRKLGLEFEPFSEEHNATKVCPFGTTSLEIEKV